MFSITRSCWFAAAHQLEGHPKCGRLHGHSYLVEVTVSGGLDLMGMVVDFAELDALIQEVVGSLDHRYLVSIENSGGHNRYVGIAISEGHSAELGIPTSTAEHLAAWIYWRLLAEHAGMTVTEVTVWETPKSKATYRPS